MKDFTTALEHDLVRAITAHEATAATGRRLTPAAPAAVSRRPGRWVVGVPVAALAAVALVALLPAGGPGAGTSAASVLRAAAASAATGGEEGFGGVRWVRYTVRRTQPVMAFVAEGQPWRQEGRVTDEQDAATWVDADWQGVTRHEPGRLVEASGTGRAVDDAVASPGVPAGEEPYRRAEDAIDRVDLRRLPREAAGLEAALRAARRPGLDAATARWDLVVSVVRLLSFANAPADLRAAAFGVLGRLEGARALGEQRDSRGRAGQGVEFDVTPDQRVRLVVDPGSGDLLETTTSTPGGYDTRVTFDASARVERAGQTP
ncbi:hypothetical protein [Conexibacter sp. SYSU D00693]|uniref:hypothetical protein n=1 Tax=Conexibacter sp. SYSU D00693 TaxID=2812560 RepID=UPI00196B4DAC|nr:hypothetical protein [Conexibacter sp. SYSU D00693]